MPLILTFLCVVLQRQRVFIPNSLAKICSVTSGYVQKQKINKKVCVCGGGGGGGWGGGGSKEIMLLLVLKRDKASYIIYHISPEVVYIA